MKCKKCGTVRPVTSDSAVCPDCGTEVELSGGFTDIVKALKYIIRELGADIYLQPQLVLAYLEKLAPNLRDERRLMKYCAALNIFAELYKINDSAPADKYLMCWFCSSKLCNEMYLRVERADKAVFIIASSLGWNVKSFTEFRYSHKSDTASQQDDSSLSYCPPGVLSYAETVIAVDQNRYNSVIDSIKYYAEQGSGYMQDALGKCYYFGFGVTKDRREAFKWYKKAAAQGKASAYAMFNMALGFYRGGENIEKNPQLAFFWFRKAAEAGHIKSQFMLGNMYYEGNGIAQNYKMALRWYKKSAEQGYVCAQYQLGRVYFNGWGTDINYTEAVKWFEKAAAAGFAPSVNALALCFTFGKGTAQDYDKALSLYLKAANMNNTYAQNNLGMCYKVGRGVPQDYAEAVKWFRTAAENGEPAAMQNLAICYEQGDGVPVDLTEASAWYKKAAECGLDYSVARYGIVKQKIAAEGKKRRRQVISLFPVDENPDEE